MHSNSRVEPHGSPVKFTPTFALQDQNRKETLSPCIQAKVESGMVPQYYQQDIPVNLRRVGTRSTETPYFVRRRSRTVRGAYPRTKVEPVKGLARKVKTFYLKGEPRLKELLVEVKAEKPQVKTNS